MVEVGLEESLSSSQPPSFQRCKQKYSKIIKERAENTTVVARTLRESQAEAPKTPKPASMETDRLLKVKEEEKTTGGVWLKTKQNKQNKTKQIKQKQIKTKKPDFQVKPILEILHSAKPDLCFTLKLCCNNCHSHRYESTFHLSLNPFISTKTITQTCRFWKKRRPGLMVASRAAGRGEAWLKCDTPPLRIA